MQISLHFQLSIEKLDAIAHNNLKLANRIFDIMEGPGLISNILKDRENGAGSNHPGTLNFNTRVKEAERIHLQNISMAMRLDNVKPYIHKILPAKVSSSPTNSPRGHSARKTKKNKHGVPGLDFPKGLFNQGNDQNTGKSNASNQSSARINKSKTRIKSSKKSPDKKNSSNVLLEYSKIQNGRVLDVAVIKEPYQDRYAIFGIDIDNGQRYELRLSSDNVSSILDGDILVTSLDNVEVWMALLNKVDLDPVESFSKLSTKHIAPAEPLITSTTATEVNEPVREPEAPAVGRPTTRPGGRGSRAATRPGIETEAARSDNAFEAQEIADVEVPMEVVEVEPIEEVFAEEAEVGEVMESEIEVPKQVEVEEEKEIQEVSVPVSPVISISIVLFTLNVYAYMCFVLLINVEQGRRYLHSFACERRH